MRPPSAFGWTGVFYLFGVVLSTGSTLALFVVFANHSSARQLGAYVVASSLYGIAVRFMDGVLSYAFLDWRRRQPVPAAGYLTQIRWLVANLSTCVMFAIACSFAIGLDVWSATVFAAGQSLFFAALTHTVISGAATTVFRAQGVNAACYAASCLVAVSMSSMSASAMLTLHGSASAAAGGVVLLAWGGLHPGLGGNHSASLRTIRLPTALLHAANATTASIDSALAGRVSYSEAAAYQALQRPLLGLGALNAAVGQWALGRTHALAARSLPTAILLAPFAVWPAIGLAVAWVMELVLPATVPISFIAATLLAFAYAAGAVTQVTGARLVGRGQIGWLAGGAIAQLAALSVVGVVAVVDWGAAGVALAVLVSRATLLSSHLLGLQKERK